MTAKRKEDQLPPVDRFPLAWPVGSARTPAEARKAGQFRAGNSRVSVEAAVRRVSEELERLGGENPVLSTNMRPIGLLGNLSDTRLENDDPGAAIYFSHKGRPIVFACDTFTRVADNIAAIGNHIEAIRAIERYGVGRMEQILVGFQRQLTGRKAWWEVLGVGSEAAPDVVEKAYKRLVQERHPDRPGGSTEKFQELSEAYQLAKQERGGQ